MRDLSMLRTIAYVLLIVGGLNLGLMGLFNVNLIIGILGNLIGRLLFIIIGIAAGYKCYLFYLEKFNKPTV